MEGQQQKAVASAVAKKVAVAEKVVVTEEGVAQDHEKMALEEEVSNAINDLKLGMYNTLYIKNAMFKKSLYFCFRLG